MTPSDRLTGRAALVLSLLALVVSLGGVSYAAVKINGSQIKKGTITAKQVKDGSLLGADFRSGQLPAGPQGPTGPAGPGARYVDLGVSPTGTETVLADGLTLDWECSPGVDAILQMTSVDAQWTGTVWNNGSPTGQSIQQGALVLGGLEAASQRGFTGTVRNTVTGTAVWLDALFKMDGSSCQGRAVATPLT